MAVLTFVKSAYRLGETILGVVDINFPGGRTKVLKVSNARFSFTSFRLLVDSRVRFWFGLPWCFCRFFDLIGRVIYIMTD